MNIGIVYHQEETNDAMHAWEVFQNEADSQRIPFEIKGKNKLQFGTIVFWLINPDKDDKWLRPKITFEKLFVTTKAKKMCPEVEMKTPNPLFLMPYPTQAIIDYVREVEHTKHDVKVEVITEKEPAPVQQTMEEYLTV